VVVFDVFDEVVLVLDVFDGGVVGVLIWVVVFDEVPGVVWGLGLVCVVVVCEVVFDDVADVVCPLDACCPPVLTLVLVQFALTIGVVDTTDVATSITLSTTSCVIGLTDSMIGSTLVNNCPIAITE